MTGNVVRPKRGSDTYISAIGHLDSRLDLCREGSFLNLVGLDTGGSYNHGDRAWMDLCILASKLAYENATVVENIIVHHWKVSRCFLLQLYIYSLVDQMY